MTFDEKNKYQSYDAVMIETDGSFLPSKKNGFLFRKFLLYDHINYLPL